MSKKITDENGNTYVQKKPFYKRIWFIALVIIIVIAGFSSMSKGSDDSSSSKSESSTSKSSDSKSASSENKSVPQEYKSALASAKTYSDTMHMSKAAIYDQLTADAGDKFSKEAAQYAVDNLKADYNKNALKSAESYQKDQNMSPEAIREQLTAEAGDKFTQDEANYAIDHLSK